MVTHSAALVTIWKVTKAQGTAALGWLRNVTSIRLDSVGPDHGNVAKSQRLLANAD